MDFQNKSKLVNNPREKPSKYYDQAVRFGCVAPNRPENKYICTQHVASSIYCQWL